MYSTISCMHECTFTYLFCSLWVAHSMCLPIWQILRFYQLLTSSASTLWWFWSFYMARVVFGPVTAFWQSSPSLVIRTRNCQPTLFVRVSINSRHLSMIDNVREHVHMHNINWNILIRCLLVRVHNLFQLCLCSQNTINFIELCTVIRRCETAAIKSFMTSHDTVRAHTFSLMCTLLANALLTAVTTASISYGVILLSSYVIVSFITR